MMFSIIRNKSSLRFLLTATMGAGLWLPRAVAQEAPKLGCAEMETFLQEATIGAQKGTARGVTNPHHATLTDGKITHDAGIQTVHESKAKFATPHGTELNFKDWWEFNVAGYRLAKLLELNMVPPYVERKVGGKSASMTWWVNDTTMEIDRIKKNQNPPDPVAWNFQMFTARVFNQLIYNTDANLTNFLITKDWHIWLIDFTRAFRTEKSLFSAKDLVQCDRKVLARMKQLDKATLDKSLKPYLDDAQIDAILARRDKIVAFFDDRVAKDGEGAVLFDLPQASEPCGKGL